MPLVAQIADQLVQRRWRLVTAESCTGGLVAKLLTDRAGSSTWFERGLVVYSNRAKTDLLGVPAALLQQFGAVSEAVARAMAIGALQHADVDVALSITGIAGPDGGTADKPVGLVWFGWAMRGPVALTEQRIFSGDRDRIRRQAAQHALHGLLKSIQHGA